MRECVCAYACVFVYLCLFLSVCASVCICSGLKKNGPKGVELLGGVMCVCVYVLYGMEPIELCILTKCSTTGLYLPLLVYLKINTLFAFSRDLEAYFVKIILK